MRKKKRYIENDYIVPVEKIITAGKILLHVGRAAEHFDLYHLLILLYSELEQRVGEFFNIANVIGS